MFATFKNQRDEEMGLMTAGEQGKYLLEMGNWRQEMMKKMKESGKEIIHPERYLSEKAFQTLRPCDWD